MAVKETTFYACLCICISIATIGKLSYSFYYSNNIASRRHKNVLILLADDAGLEIGAYGNPHCQTPNLDKLASRSAIFRRAYTAVSSCSPSRSSILTGLPPHQNGMYGLHQDQHHFFSFDEVKSLPLILRKHGVRTGIVGKKHVGPEKVYPFDFSSTEENNSILQVGRNITRMKELVQEFLDDTGDRPFFLYIGFHDAHRCGHSHPEYGTFCEKFGNGEPGMGLIPDWIPVQYDSNNISVPYFVPDTPVTRADIAKQYTTISRLDQGIGVILQEFTKRKLMENTLILYTSDNGIPFPCGRTNLWEPGIIEPLLLHSPHHRSSWGKDVFTLTSHLDILPTILDWLHIPYPQYTIFQKRVIYTGKSMLPFLNSDSMIPNQAVYGSHSLHEVTMFYPMRSIRTDQYKLIHNMNWQSPFPIDQDFYVSPTFQEILDFAKLNQTLPWVKTLEDYYYRPQWELYDIINDSEEKNNLAGESEFRVIFHHLKRRLSRWMNVTNDPWLCYPHGVLEDRDTFKDNPSCLPLYNKRSGGHKAFVHSKDLGD